MCGSYRVRAGYPLLACVLYPHGGYFYFILFVKKHTKGNIKMKKIITSSVSVILVILSVLCLFACAEKVPAEGLWENATYRSDKEFGNGAKTVKVEVKVGEQSVTFTINTDKETLGEALLEHSLIEGEEGPFGIYIKKVNGILADFDTDQSYWGFYKDGVLMMTGVDGTNISDGEHYELVRTK